MSSPSSKLTIIGEGRRTIGAATYAIVYETDEQLQALLGYADRWDRIAFTPTPSYQIVVHRLETKQGLWLATTGRRSSQTADGTTVALILVDILATYTVRCFVMLAEGVSAEAALLGQVVMGRQVWYADGQKWLGAPRVYPHEDVPVCTLSASRNPKVFDPFDVAISDLVAGMANASSSESPYVVLAGVRSAGSDLSTSSFGPQMLHILQDTVAHLPSRASYYDSPAGLNWFAAIAATPEIYRAFEYQVHEADPEEDGKHGRYWLLYPGSNKVIVLAWPFGSVADLLVELHQRYPYVRAHLGMDVCPAVGPDINLVIGRLWSNQPLVDSSRYIASAVTAVFTDWGRYAAEIAHIAKKWGYPGEILVESWPAKGSGVGTQATLENKEMLKNVSGITTLDWTPIAEAYLDYYMFCGLVGDKPSKDDLMLASIRAATVTLATILVR